MCGICEIKNQEDLNLFSQHEIDELILNVFTGTVNIRNLDSKTYKKIAQLLEKSVYTGYGATLDATLYESPDFFILKALQENVYVFSAAKVYQQTREMESVLRELSKAMVSGEKINPFNEFKKQASVILKEYNENYLKAEYQSARQQAQSASQWQEIIKEEKYLPMLTYVTAGDGRVRPTHQVLNNISRPVKDKFWDKFMPPNGWNCRCHVQQSSDAEQTNLQGFKTPKDVPKIFQFNAGKEKIVFSPKHPYFKVAARDKNFAQTNFGLPLP